MANGLERRPDKRSAIRGCLIGGAAGDALGYPIEFNSYKEIVRCYGEDGLRKYALDRQTGLALISDDTQMTLFTAVGLLAGRKDRIENGSKRPLEGYVGDAYLEWYRCQSDADIPEEKRSWLSAVPEMHAARAPGNTCMSALHRGKLGWIDEPVNSSKGCGGVMRAAPVGLCNLGEMDIGQIDNLAAQTAALTHGHSLGWLPAAALAHIVYRSVYGGCPYGDGLHDIVRECGDTLERVYPDVGFVRRLRELMDRAGELAQNSEPDETNIRMLGSGWTGEEALAIALYCALKYENDFSKAIIAAVNHGGDSDSTGSIAGNIVGARLGMEGIEEKWLDKLECRDVILKVADELWESASAGM